VSIIGSYDPQCIRYFSPCPPTTPKQRQHGRSKNWSFRGCSFAATCVFRIVASRVKSCMPSYAYVRMSGTSMQGTRVTTLPAPMQAPQVMQRPPPPHRSCYSCRAASSPLVISSELPAYRSGLRVNRLGETKPMGEAAERWCDHIVCDAAENRAVQPSRLAPPPPRGH